VSARSIVPRELANRDVAQAIEYYINEAGHQAASAFVDALEQAYRHISRHPASGSSRYAVELNLPGLRAWPLRSFPHVVFYVETQNCIDVWRVLHGARHIPASMQEQNSG
jgi:toxin ParE1/3/4